MARITSSAGRKIVPSVFEFLALASPLQALKIHSDELALLDDEARGGVIDDNLYAFFFGIFELPP